MKTPTPLIPSDHPDPDHLTPPSPPTTTHPTSPEAQGFVSSLLVLSPPERPSASQARSHGWLANAPSTPLLTPRRLRAPDSPYAPSRTSRPAFMVPSCLLPAARERAEPPPSDATTHADAEAAGPLPLPLPPVRTFSSPTDTTATTPPILSVALLPVAAVAEGAWPLPGARLQARIGSRLKLLATGYYSLLLATTHYYSLVATFSPPGAQRQRVQA
jgi:serine/threonine protein kinase